MNPSFTFGDTTVSVFSTGQVSVKNRFRDARFKGALAQLDFLLDRSFTEWMPIWVWVIQHPEGTFVIDTGENANVNDPDYFDSSGRFNKWINTTQFKFQVERAEEADRQLARLGIHSVDKVILTHLHLDHIDGLRHFPDSEILVNRYEWEKPYGDLPGLYPEGFSPTLLDLDEAFATFPRAKKLTQRGDLILVETPGHTYGHCSVALKVGNGYLFISGDVCYNQEQFLAGRHSGADVSHKLAEQSYARIRDWAAKEKVLLLPSHDEGVGERLERMAFL